MAVCIIGNNNLRFESDQLKLLWEKLVFISFYFNKTLFSVDEMWPNLKKSDRYEKINLKPITIEAVAPPVLVVTTKPFNFKMLQFQTHTVQTDSYDLFYLNWPIYAYRLICTYISLFSFICVLILFVIERIMWQQNETKNIELVKINS